MPTAERTSQRRITPSTFLYFRWAGGPYIDISVNGLSNPHDVINVWDYETGTAAYPFTTDGLRSAVDAYLADYETDDILSDLSNAHYPRTFI